MEWRRFVTYLSNDPCIKQNEQFTMHVRRIRYVTVCSFQFCWDDYYNCNRKLSWM